jgi:hypothetical protein
VTAVGHLHHRLDTPKGMVEVILTDGQNVTVHAPFASPPGSPLSGLLHGTQHELRIKVHGCRRIATNVESSAANVNLASTWFEITGRWVSLSRAAKLALLEQTESA